MAGTGIILTAAEWNANAALQIRESDQEIFFRVLFHDDRNSYYFVSSDKDGVWHDQPIRSDALPYLTFNPTANYYITHNGFTAKRRQTERLRQLNALFFDLDCHGASPAACDTTIAVGLALLEQAILNGTLPQPTMMVDSGRGIHLYYVLERSVPYRFRGKGEVNDKGVQFFNSVQNRLAEILEEIMAPLESLEVDRAVFDATRVSRIPGTFNRKAGRQATLVEHREIYHQLSDLASYKPSQTVKPLPTKKRSATILSFHPLMMSRLNKVLELQEYRQFSCEGKRELMSFVFYNTAVQIYTREDAWERLVAFNDRFHCPLRASELTGIRKAVDSVVNVKGERGFYYLNASKLIDMLGLTKKEMEDIHFFASKRMVERLEAKRKTKEKREKRNEAIIELYQRGTMTQAEVAQAVGCSERTVYSILRLAGHTSRHKELRSRSRATLAQRIGSLAPSGRFSSNPQRILSYCLESAKKWHTCLRVVLFSGLEGLGFTHFFQNELKDADFTVDFDAYSPTFSKQTPLTWQDYLHSRCITSKSLSLTG